MTAWKPIPISQAVRLFERIAAPDDAAIMLADFAEAGLVRSYARLIEAEDANGQKSTTRDGRIDRTVWKRIIADAKVGELAATGSVRLSGSGFIGGAPALAVIGVRCDESSIVRQLEQHGGGTTAQIAVPAPPVDSSPAPSLALFEPAEEMQPDQLPARARTIDPDAPAFTVDETMDLLRLGKTTVYKLMERGDLSFTKVGRRTIINGDSVRAIINAGC